MPSPLNGLTMPAGVSDEKEAIGIQRLRLKPMGRAAPRIGPPAGSKAELPLGAEARLAQRRSTSL
jgi:hypothetical protein